MTPKWIIAIGVMLACLTPSLAARAQDAPPPPGAGPFTTLGAQLPWSLERQFPKEFRDIAFPLPDQADAWVVDLENWVESIGGDGAQADFSGLSCITPLAVEHVAAYVAALGDLEPLTDWALSSFVYYANLGLKQCSPLAVVPAPRAFDVDADTCKVVVEDQRKHQDWNYVFGLALPGLSYNEGDPLAANRLGGAEPRGLKIDWPDLDWGPLGTPRFLHYNTAVKGYIAKVRSLSHGSTFDFDVAFDVAHPMERDLEFRVGHNEVTWNFQSLVSILDLLFIYVPPAPPGNKGPSMWKAAGALELYGLPVAGLFTSNDTVSGTEISLRQEVTVWDRVPPVITTNQEEFTFEGTIFGGTSIQQDAYREQMLAALEYSDACDNPVELVQPTPVLWPVGQTTPVTWTVLDPGPNDQSPRADQRNAASIVQRVTVVDTIAPTIRPPVPLAHEVAPGTAGPVALAPRPPEVFDYVDAHPDVANDAPGGELFGIGKTDLTWTATDQSGNASQATQIVNVKVAGTNQPPLATPQTGGDAQSAESFREIPIALRATDPDGDPLAFRISDPPDHGFFVAPLLPYFFGDARQAEVSANRCASSGRKSEDLFDPEYVTSSDAGLTYVLNAALDCTPGSNAVHRITVFDRDRNFVVARDLPRTRDFFRALHLDERRGFLLYTTGEILQPGTVLKLDPTTLDTIAEYEVPDSNPKKAVIDVRFGREVLYVTGNDTENLGNFDVYDLTKLDPAETFHSIGADEFVASIELGAGGPPSGLFNALDMAIDSQGNLYVASLDRRIHKFEPFSLDGDGNVVPGEQIGWMGACTGGPLCDVANQTSRGYTCSFESCEVTYPLPSTGLGQLGALGGMAMDPNDVLYVAEFGNLRVQRFTPGGFYAGHARSSCDSDELCFVLGEFGRPNAVGVNSSHFFVLDRDLDVVHIFDTSVVELVGPTEARVTYKSDSGFFNDAGAGIDVGLDRFAFVASDGFDESAPAVVEIDVRRGHHPAVPVDGKRVRILEDRPTQIRLDALDPDFPLDPFTFRVTTPPEHGGWSINPEGDSGDLRYVPSKNFFGEDRLTFTVDDGSGESAPATLYISVVPVNDAPSIVDATDSAQAGRGYPYLFEFRFDDVEFDAPGHEATISWGDGSGTDNTGTAAEISNRPAHLFKATRPGRVVAQHTYTGLGLHEIAFCIYDGEAVPVCDTRTVNTMPMADFSVEIQDQNSFVPVGGELEYVFAARHRATEGNVGPALINDVIVRANHDDGLRVLEVVPERGSCEVDERPGQKSFVCNLGVMAEGETLLVRARFAVDAPAQQISAEVSSSLPDPNGAIASATVETVAASVAKVAALAGSSDGGTLSLKVAGVSLAVPLPAGRSAEEIAQMVAAAVADDATLAGAGVTATVAGRLVELSHPIDSLQIDEGGIERARPVRFASGQLTLDLDSLGIFRSPPSSGTAFLDSMGDVTLPSGALAPIDVVSAANGPPEIASLAISGGTLGAGSVGASGLFELPLAGQLTLERTQGPPAGLPLSVLGAEDGFATSQITGSEFALFGERWSIDPFSSDAWTIDDGVTATRSFAGADERDPLGEGRLLLVSPATLEVYVDETLVEVVPGGVELSLELVPEPTAALRAAVGLVSLAWMAHRRRRKHMRHPAGSEDVPPGAACRNG